LNLSNFNSKAEDLFKKSLEIALELGNPQREASALNQLGQIAFSQGNIQSALSFYQDSLVIRSLNVPTALKNV